MEQSSELAKITHLPQSVVENPVTTLQGSNNSAGSEIEKVLVEILDESKQKKTENSPSQISYITGSKELDERVEAILGKGWEKDDDLPAREIASDYTQQELDELIESILGKGWELDDEPQTPQSAIVPQAECVHKTHKIITSQNQPLSSRVNKTTLPATEHLAKKPSIEAVHEVKKSRTLFYGLFILTVLIGAIAAWTYLLSTSDNTLIKVKSVSTQSVPDASKMTTTDSPLTAEPSDVATQTVTTKSSSEIAIEAPTNEDMLTINLPVEKDIERNISEAEGSAIAKPPTREVIIYTIVSGDTFWSIADRFVNNPYKYAELAEQNRVNNPNLIYPGNKIRIIKFSK